MGFEQIEHTADVGLRVWAPTLGELFAEAARGLIAVMGRAHGEEVTRIDVALEAGDLGALLVDWLSELLYVFEAKEVVPLPVDVSVAEDPPTLWATIGGPPVASFEQLGPGVKAVTYHRLSVTRTSDGWSAEVFLDV